MNMRLSALAVSLALLSGLAFAAPSTAVTTQTIRIRTLSQTVTANGRLVPAPGAIQWLSAPQDGRVADVLVTSGTAVVKGQGLVRIEPTPQSLAVLKSAQSDLQAAQVKLKQTRTLAKNGLATQADLAAAESAAASARARLDALQSGDGGANGSVIKAVTAGVVTQVPVSPGEWVNAGTHLAALAPSGSLWVRLGLTPEQAAAVMAGAPVRLVPVFGAGQPLESRVAKVDAQADSSTGLIDAEVPVPAGPAGPFTGEWVAGTITVSSEKLPAVARSAILNDAQGPYVFVVRNGTAHRVGVKPLIRENGLVGVKGVKPGDVVVTSGNFELNDGDSVRITKGSTE